MDAGSQSHRTTVPKYGFLFGNKLNTDRSTLTLNYDSSQAYDIAFLDSPSGTTLPGSGSWMHTPEKFNLHEEHAKGPNQRNWLLTEGGLEGVESTGSLEVIMSAPSGFHHGTLLSTSDPETNCCVVKSSSDKPFGMDGDSGCLV